MEQLTRAQKIEQYFNNLRYSTSASDVEGTQTNRPWLSRSAIQSQPLHQNYAKPYRPATATHPKNLVQYFLLALLIAILCIGLLSFALCFLYEPHLMHH
jgi:hypothetical protein